MQEASRVQLTYEDLLSLPDDGRRHELLGGEHFVTASPSTRHQRILIRLTVGLETYLTNNKVGELLAAPCDVVFSDADVLVPDLLVVTQTAAGIVTEANVQGAPGLVIEILSPSTASRDRGLKRKLYEKFGVQEYWIVDPDAEVVEPWLSASGRLVSTEPLARGEFLTSRLLPGFRMSIDEVLGSQERPDEES